MGAQNAAVNRILERRELFADLMNGILYGGRQVLKAGNLELLTGRGGLIHDRGPGRKYVLERQGDIRMKARLGTYSLIVSNETQGKVHYAMPVRAMLYDALEYTKQIQDLERHHRQKKDLKAGDEFLSGISKEDRISPVISVVLYFGKKWDGSISLYEMLDMDPEDPEIAPVLAYLPDYRINLINGNDIPNPGVFHTCLQHIFSMLKYNREKERLYRYIKEHKDEINRMDEAEITAAFVLLGEQKRLVRLLEEQREEEFDVCKAIDDLIKDGEERGMEQGIKAYIKLCQQVNFSQSDTITHLIQAFKLTEEAARKSVSLYWQQSSI